MDQQSSNSALLGLREPVCGNVVEKPVAENRQRLEKPPRENIYTKS